MAISSRDVARYGYLMCMMSGLGERIREAADEVGGLKRLAENIDVPRRTLGNWLSGTQPKPEHLQRIADTTGVSLQWLISGEGQKKADAVSAMARLAKLTENPGHFTNEEFEELVQSCFNAAMRKADIATREAPQAPAVDIVLLQRLSDVVQAVFIECKQSAPPRAITAEAGNLYNELLQMVVDAQDEEVVLAILPVLRARFKKRLEEAAAQPGSGKRSVS